MHPLIGPADMSASLAAVDSDIPIRLIGRLEIWVVAVVEALRMEATA